MREWTRIGLAPTALLTIKPSGRGEIGPPADSEERRLAERYPDMTLADMTRVRNRLHALLLLCDPTYKTYVPDLTTGPASARARLTPRLARVCLHATANRRFGRWPPS